MYNRTSSDLEGYIRKKKVRDKRIFKEAQVIYLEESYHRNRMSADTFGVLEDGRRHSERTSPRDGHFAGNDHDKQ
jgi:hypothetical protein